MNCYIEVKDGQPINHPAVEENLLDAFGCIPEGWEIFVRVEKPVPPLYKKLASEFASYEKVNGVWTDVWQYRDMTPEEKEAFQQSRKNSWARLPNAFNYTAWVFNEETAEFEPPIPKPEVDDVNYRWDGSQNAWREAPTKPDDGNVYKFDFVAWEWVVL